MSMRFNKQTPEDFGLKFVDGKYIRTSDGSEWVNCQLYDFGWGSENGFYKKPLGTFEELMNMVISDDDEEDSYGAAAIIDKLYPKELKDYLLESMTLNVPECVKKKLNEIFRLNKGTNRTTSVGLTLSEIKKEYNDWTLIAEYYSKYKN
jgi:hypothetical protein